jgi:hypothetical protein
MTLGMHIHFDTLQGALIGDGLHQGPTVLGADDPQVEGGLAEQVLPGKAEGAAVAAIHFHQRSISQATQGDQDGGGLEDLDELLLRGPEFLLGLFAQGDVPHGHDQPFVAMDGRLAHVHFHPEQSAGMVLGQPFENLGRALRGFADPADGLLCCVRCDAAAEGLELQNLELVAGIAEHLRGALVHVKDGPGRQGMDEDGVVGGIEDGLEIRFGQLDLVGEDARPQ